VTPPDPRIILRRLERAREVAAAVIARDGPATLPLFERIDAEIASLQAADSALDRARRLAAEGRFAKPRRRNPTAA
jgi:hypothetical protein